MRAPGVLPCMRRLTLFAVAVAMLAACAPAPASPTAAPAPTAAPPAKPAEKPAPTAAAAKPAEQPAAKAAAKELFKLEFAAPWILPTTAFYMLLAEDKGFYREEGLQVNINEGSGSGNAVKIVGAGSTPVGLADANRILAGRVNDVPVKSVMSLLYTSPVLVMSHKDKPIKTLSDLIGKKLADAPDSANILIWHAAMKRAGLDHTKVNFINVDPKAKLQLLQAGQVDALLGQSDSAQLEAEGFPLYRLLVTEDAGFEIVADSLFAHEEFLTKNPEIMKAFLRATIKSAKYGKERPSEAVDAAQRRAPTFSRRQLELTLQIQETWIWTKFTPTEKFGLQSLPSWSNLQDLLFDNKQIDKKIDLKTVVDNSFLPYQ